jgi:hypothetical protein
MDAKEEADGAGNWKLETGNHLIYTLTSPLNSPLPIFINKGAL